MNSVPSDYINIKDESLVTDYKFQKRKTLSFAELSVKGSQIESTRTPTPLKTAY